MKPIKTLLAGTALCLLVGCANPGAAPPDAEHDGGFDPALAHALELTPSQRLEDYDALCGMLQESFLCLGVRDREHPEDPSAEIFREYRAMVETHDSDHAFYSAVYSTLYRLGPYGHLWMIEPELYHSYVELYRTGNFENREPWQKILEDPVSAAGYEKLGAMLDTWGGDDAAPGEEVENPPAENIHALLLDGSKTAYVKIDGFPWQYAGEQEQLFSFYETLGDCTDLIFDITENGGGSELYWQNLLVAPFLDAPLSCTNYALLADTKQNRPYIEAVFSPEDLHSITDLPQLPALNLSGIASATHYVESTLTAAPGSYRSPFHGRIWVLVGPGVYSASESFAVFCKETGFATLVGGGTGGDGIGALDPVLLQLPNSGLLVQYTMMFGLNRDGSSNEEMGTTPELPSPAGEPALVTALRAAAQR